MDLFSQLDVNNIDFVLIDRLIRSNNSTFEDMLEFTIWEKPKGLSIVGYKLKHTMEDAFKILDKLCDYDVYSNYMITDLEDSRVLAGISCNESLVTKLLGEGELKKIELKVPANSIYNVLYKGIKENAVMSTTDSEGFSSLRGLYFNESTLDIVWRYKDPMSGFKTYTVMQEDIINDFTLRCANPLGLSCCTQHSINGGMVEHNFIGSSLSSEGFELYSNGVKLDNIYTIAIVSIEVLINYFARAFENTILSKTVDALHAHVCEFEPTKHGRSLYKAPRVYDKICTIKYPTRMPSTSKILEFMNEIDYKSDMKGNLPTLLDKCSELYSDDTLRIIKEGLEYYQDRRVIDLMPITKIDSVNVGNTATELAILANCLKNNFGRNDIFRQSHVGKLSRLASAVFDTSVDIQTFPDQNVLIQQYMRQNMNSK